MSLLSIFLLSIFLVPSLFSSGKPGWHKETTNRWGKRGCSRASVQEDRKGREGKERGKEMKGREGKGRERKGRKRKERKRREKKTLWLGGRSLSDINPERHTN